MILRQVHAELGDTSVRIRLDVRGGFGRDRMQDLHRHDDGTWTARTGDLLLRWTGAQEAVADDRGALELVLRLSHGARHDLVLEISDRALPIATPSAALWASTEQQWRARVPDLSATAAPRDARLAAAVLHGLTTTGGGMVAAATMSLPERADRHRNYDYRYAWIRDQCYAGMAAAQVGIDDLLESAVRFVTERVHSDGPELRPAYLVDGGRVPDERTLDLPGYPGGTDVVGNWVNDQFQLDSLGECLRLFATAAQRDRLDADGWAALRSVVATIGSRWNEPDAGIWELTPDWWTHSRLACVAGLRQAAQVLPGGRSGRTRAIAPRGADLASADLAGTDLEGLAETILARTTATCLHPEGYWQRWPRLTGVDASLVWPAVNGALPADDPRTRATLAAVVGDLAEDYHAYRYRADEGPLGRDEGAFLLCGFMVAIAENHGGDRVQAMRWFERTRSACGSPGLFTEEVDVGERQLRGNLPQAFVHALMLQAAHELA